MTPPKSTPSKEAPAKGNGKHILIVEDEHPLAHALELKFRHEGFETTIAADGDEALKEAAKGGYDLILLDLIMPRMDGFTFMQEMKAKGVHTPTIILSNLGQDEDKNRAKELGAVAYFVKSNTPIMEIVKQVQSTLH
ncbi:MAG: response regulator [Candidatus Peribacteraceae bacterium]|nr:response regulator [Candidatus Peribacteraceae bacterium]